MPIPRVLIHSLDPDLALESLKQTHPDIEPVICTDDEKLLDSVNAFTPDIVFSVRSGGNVFPRAALVESPSVKWVSNAGSGVNHLMPWNPEQVTVTNSAGVAADMMAEFALGIMLHFSLDINGLQRDRKRKHWQLNRLVEPIQNKTVVILGLGKTGQALARKSKSMGMNVHGVRANPKPTDCVDQVFQTTELKQALKLADYVVVCLPLLDSTQGLLGAGEFDYFKENAVLIDLSRGGIVQEQALIDALKHNKIAGAGLDVFETEPLPDNNPLWSFENVVISPHCSSVYDGWEKVSAQMFVDNLSRWRRGDALMNIVDPTRGY